MNPTVATPNDMHTLTPQLETIAKRVVWWKPPGESLANADDFLCRVMTFGLWGDAVHVLEVYGEDALRHAIKHAPAGVFDEPSWHYWHNRLGLNEIPCLPTRILA
jgi:hypothetical protein